MMVRLDVLVKNIWKGVKMKLLICCLMLFVVFSIAFAESDRPITILLTVAPGVAKDVVVRSLISNSKFPIVILNKPGAGGAIALAQLSNSKADGYTLASGEDGSLISTSLLQPVPYKPLRDFSLIMGFAIGGRGALLVRNESPWKTFNDFIDYTKRNPGKVTYSSAGFGMPMHLNMEIIAHKEAISWVHIPSKGSVAARAALTSGCVDICSSGADWIYYVGKETGLRPLVSVSDTRTVGFPNVPSIKEFGYDPLLEVWNIMGPIGLSLETVKRLENMFTELASNQKFKIDSERMNVTVNIMNGSKLVQYVSTEWVRREKLFRELGII